MSAERMTTSAERTVQVQSIARYETTSPSVRISLLSDKGSLTATGVPGGHRSIRGNEMNQLLKLIVAVQLRAADLRDSDRGATATEYALLVAFIAIAVIGGVTLFGTQLNSFFSNLGSKIGIL